MALIYCSECGKEVSDRAPNCLNCGYSVSLIKNKIAVPAPTQQYNSYQAISYQQSVPQNDQVKCPKCRSTQISANKKGFSGGKAVAGVILVGGIGALAGTSGSNKIKITCLSCGYTFEPGQSHKIQGEPLTTKEGVSKVIIPVIIFVILFILILHFVGFLAALAFMLVVLFIGKLILTPN